MSIVDFPKPILPVTGCREHRLADDGDVDETLTAQERNRSKGRDYYERNRAKVLAKRSTPEAKARARAYYLANRDHIQALNKKAGSRAAQRAVGREAREVRAVEGRAMKVSSLGARQRGAWTCPALPTKGRAFLFDSGWHSWAHGAPGELVPSMTATGAQ